MTTLFRCLSVLPLGLLHALGWLAGWITYLSSPRYRQRFGHNARLAGYGLAQVGGAIGHAGRMVAETPRLWMGAPVRCEWVGEEMVEAAYAARKGVVFLTPHMGCFEITAQGLAERFGPRYGAITVLYRPARQPWLSELVANARKRAHLETAPTTLSGVRQMMRALRAGQAVGLLPDQVPPEGMGLWTPFFGAPAYTMTLSARLALQTGAAVLLVWGERLPFARGFRLHFRALAQPLAQDLAAAVAQINAEMERVIRDCPEQYLWGYARYKQPRREAAA
jgi:KDO2-lipid IV(A) lauroyltransferase